MSTEQAKPDILLREKNIEKAMENLCDGASCHQVARLLNQVSYTGRISYQEARQLLGDDLEEALLSAVCLRLLIPVRSINDSLNWVDAMLILEPGEIYKMPNIARQIVKHAEISGEWDPGHAISNLFEKMGDPSWNLMPVLIQRLCETATDQHINSFEIGKVCTEMGLGDRVGAMILELKGAGIISPKLDSFAEVRRAGAPIYEINRSVLLGLS